MDRGLFERKSIRILFRILLCQLNKSCKLAATLSLPVSLHLNVAAQHICMEPPAAATTLYGKMSCENHSAADGFANFLR
jgi:hypothetical protein